MEYLCVDIGGTKIKCAIVSDKYEILDYYQKDAGWQTREEFLNCIEDIFRNSHFDLSGIAISYCGELDPFQGIIFNGGSYPFNNSLKLKKALEERCKVSVSVENDGNCAALAEMRNGVLKDARNAVMLVLGTGIGCAIMMNKKLYRGSHFYAGAPTFAMVDLKDKLDWGNTLGVWNGVGSLLREYDARKNLEERTTDGIEFFARVNDNDEISLEILKKYTQRLAAYIYNLQTLLDLDVVAIGGGISSQPLLESILKQELQRLFQGFEVKLHIPELRICKYYNDANLLGALYYHLSSGSDVL